MLDQTENQAWNILMIDDDEDDYLLTNSMLKQAQGHVINLDWAHTLEVGREKLANTRYDAVLIDYDFGAYNGIDLIRELAARRYPAPLILYTGRGSFEVDVEAMQAGATLYLPKADANPLMLERSIRYAIERKQSMDSLRESEERFRSVLKNSQDVAYRRNLQTERYDYLSLSSLQVLGFTPEEMSNMSMAEVIARIHPDDREQIERGLERAIEQGRARLLYRFLTRAGEYHWLADYISIEKDENGHPLFRSGILRDITEQKEVEQALRESEQLFRSLVDHIAQLAWMADVGGNRFWFNQRWFDYTGTAYSQVIGWGWQIVHHPDHVRRVVEKMRASFANGVPFEDTYPLRGKDGQYRWFLSRAIPLRDENGQILRWLGTDTDVTGHLETEQSLRKSEERLKAYTEQLQHSNQMLEDFAFIASHDLQEPLRKVQSFGQILRTRYAGQLGEEGRDYLARMESAAARMSAMLAGLLAYSRVSTTGQPFVDTDLRRVVDEVLSDLEVRIQQTGGQVVVGDLPVIQADPVQMRQLFQNLISNALKFHRPDTPPLVQVEARAAPDERVALSVRDNGVGFDMAQANSLFLPFYRLHSNPTLEGSGIGLAICKKIAERHHGEISVESAPGQGSTFTVVLPLRQG